MTAVFVHGNPETAAVWRELEAALAARAMTDVVTLSPPGFGAPVPDDFAATQEAYRDWLVAELESFGEPVDLVGHDWGAGHVLGALAVRADLARTWATDCVALTHPDYVWHDAAQLWQTPGTGEETVAAMFAGSVDERAVGWASLGMSESVARDIATEQDEAMGACVLTLYRSAVQPAMADLGAALRHTALPPGLVINATDDHYAGSQQMVRETTEALGAELCTLDGLGHWWMFAGAEAAAEALLAHWSR